MNAWNKFFKALGSYIKNLIIFAATCFVSWAMAMVIIWALFIKFDITTFSVQVATGIWLALFLLEKFIEGSLANRLKNVIYKL